MTQQEATIARWLYTWVTILALVVVVVIGFLLGIVHSLDSIDGHLGTATSAVVSIGGHAVPLSGYIQDINGNLTSIDTALKPIPAGASSIIAGLVSVKGNLTTVDSSLKSTLASLSPTSNALVDTSNKLVTTSDSLVSTSGVASGIATSLISTSGILKTVRGQLVTILGVLKQVRAASTPGTAGVVPRVTTANNALDSIQNNAFQINQGLQSAQKHLSSICNAPLLTQPLVGTLTSLVKLLQTTTPCGP
jgi:hypothetical protein